MVPVRSSFQGGDAARHRADVAGQIAKSADRQMSGDASLTAACWRSSASSRLFDITGEPRSGSDCGLAGTAVERA